MLRLTLFAFALLVSFNILAASAQRFSSVFVAFQVATVNNAMNTVASVSPICNLIPTPVGPPFRGCFGVPLQRLAPRIHPYGGIQTGQAGWEDALRVPHFGTSSDLNNTLYYERDIRALLYSCPLKGRVGSLKKLLA